MIRGKLRWPRYRLPRIVEDKRGATIIEFAIVAPTLCLMLMGAFDIAHTLYMDAALQGIVQKTARDSSLETGTEASVQQSLDDKVASQVRALANNATITITRRFYRTFADAAAAKAEPFTDTNGDGKCDNGEPYEDTNNNKVWDADGGDAGQGGAKDATLYTVSISYPRAFPFAKLFGGSGTTKVAASTVLRNQPYSDQGSYAPATVRNCT